MKKCAMGGSQRMVASLILSALILVGGVTGASAQTWGKTYHGPWGDWWTGTTIRDFIVTSDGGFAAVGTSNYHGVVVKLTSDGTLAWSRLFSPGLESRTTEFAGIVQTADGGYAITGQASIDPEKGGHGDWDAYVVRLDSSGGFVWERLFGRIKTSTDSYASAYGRRIYENADGTLTVTGVVLFGNIGKDCPYYGYESGLILSIGAEGALLSRYVVSGSPYGGPKNEVYKTSDGGYIAASTRFFDVWYTLNIQKFDATGGIEWTRGYYADNGGTSQYFYEHSVAEVEDGYLVATETDTGRYHLFKIDATGSVVWQKRYKIYADGSSAYPIQIVETSDGGTIVSLRSGYSTVDEVFLKTDSTGNLQWANYYNGHYMAIARSVGDGFAVATSDYDFLFASLNGTGYLGNRCAALPISPNVTTEEATPAMVVIPGKGDLSCNEAVAAGTWTGTQPDPGLLTGLAYHQVDACVPKLIVTPSPVSFYDTKVGLTSASWVGLSDYTGLGDLHLGQLSLTDTTNFALQSDGCSAQTLSCVNFPPHPTSCSLQVVFTPKSKGLKVATLSIPSDDPDGPSGVEVRGTAWLPSYTLTVTESPSGTGSVTVDPPGTVFDEGTVVTLTAQSGQGYHFDRWEGALTGTVNPGQVTMAGDRYVTAVFALNTYTVSPAAGPNGALTPSSPQTVNHGNTTSFTVSPSPGYHILSVSGCGGSLAGSTYTTGPITADCTVNASFEINSYTLTANKVGSGSGTLSAAGLTCDGGTCSGTYTHGTSVTITASADSGSIFNGFAGCDTADGMTCTVTMLSDRTVAAGFASVHTLTVIKTGDGSGTVTSVPPGINCGEDCSGIFGYSASVTLTAVPAEGSTFAGWSGGGCSGTGPCIVSVTTDTTVTAAFTSVRSLLVMTLGGGSGTVTSVPAGILCGSGGAACDAAFPANTSVTLNATPDPGSAFAYWTGACRTASPTCALTMSTDAGVVAVFVPEKTKKANLTVSKTKKNKGDGTLTSTDGRINRGGDCKDAYYPGSPVTLKAVPNEGSLFSEWSNCPSPDGDSCFLTVEKTMTVKAVFLGPNSLKVQKTAKNKGTGTITSMDGKINCGDRCTAAYPANSPIVTLTAIPGDLSVFSSWTGCTPVDEPTCTVTLDKAKTVKATFTGPSLLKVTTTLKNGATGIVTSDPPGISCPGACSEAYPYQTVVTLDAVPGDGTTTVAFSGCTPTGATACTVTMDKARTVRVTFQKPKLTAGPDTVESHGEE